MNDTAMHSTAGTRAAPRWSDSAAAFAAGPPGLTLAQRGAKRAADICGALVFFVLFGPMYVLVALAVQLSSDGPIHFWQTRMGRGGRAFRFYKFRSMMPNSDAVLHEFLNENDAARTQWDEFQKLEEDPRVTRIGRFIRRASLDELPQFWNVLKGDMSLVGPRPCMKRQRSLYGEQWGHYCAMKPGITGLWQVSGRNRLPYARRVELDAHYVAHWSLWLDLRIALRTVRAVVVGEGSC
jgi:lipopolysaccharide/colanic/teichoic acid biosynthesis glycosyltransferase